MKDETVRDRTGRIGRVEDMHQNGFHREAKVIWADGSHSWIRVSDLQRVEERAA